MTTTDTPNAADAVETSEASEAPLRRKFLVVADGSDECRVALRYAALRAALTGGCVSLLYVIEPADFQHWRAVEDRMLEEARAEAESVLHTLAGEAHDLVEIMPELLIEEGSVSDQVVAAIRNDPTIHVLVLATGASKEGPGPLVAMVAGNMGEGFSIPVTVVPGNLSDEAIDELSQ